MSSQSETEPKQVRAIAEALADVLCERGLVVSGTVFSATRVLDAAEVGRLLGRDRKWVYDHARDLGAFRYGNGPKARLGFGLAAVERWKRDRQISFATPLRSARHRRPKRRAASAGELIDYDALGPRT